MHLGVGGTNTQTITSLSSAASLAEGPFGALPRSGSYTLFWEGKDGEACALTSVRPCSCEYNKV